MDGLVRGRCTLVPEVTPLGVEPTARGMAPIMHQRDNLTHHRR
jgi:hypothetical protein